MQWVYRVSTEFYRMPLTLSGFFRFFYRVVLKLMRFCLVVVGLIGFYWVYWVSSNFNCSILGFIWSYLVLLGFYWLVLGITQFLLGFT